MNVNSRFRAASLLAGLALGAAACVSPPPPVAPPPEAAPLSASERTVTVQAGLPGASLDLADRLVTSAGMAEAGAPRYEFHGRNLPVGEAMRMFTSAHGLNYAMDPDVSGEITADFTGLTFEKAMEAILEIHGLSWEWDKDLIRVRRVITRTFTVDYLRLVRTGRGSSQAKVTSAQTAAEAGAIEISQEDSLEFWKELEGQLKKLVSGNAAVVINPLAGLVVVTDTSANVRRIEQFLTALSAMSRRQVEVEARIYEVTLSDQFSLGLDWNRIAIDSGMGTLATATNIANPFGGGTRALDTLVGTHARGDFDSVLRAMAEQGELTVVSKPRVLTLNNQPALIKVGTDVPFFQATTDQVQGTGATTTYETKFITIGVVLSVTPQISADGWIIMDITPIVTRLVTTHSIVDPDTGRQMATAPEMEVKQSSTMVRIKSGEMVVIGGLIQDTISETERKVPLLGDIPGLGKLFSSVYRDKTKRELVVFLTPRVKL